MSGTIEFKDLIDQMEDGDPVKEWAKTEGKADKIQNTFNTAETNSIEFVEIVTEYNNKLDEIRVAGHRGSDAPTGLSSINLEEGKTFQTQFAAGAEFTKAVAFFGSTSYKKKIERNEKFLTELGNVETDTYAILTAEAKELLNQYKKALENVTKSANEIDKLNEEYQRALGARAARAWRALKENEASFVSKKGLSDEEVAAKETIARVRKAQEEGLAATVPTKNLKGIAFKEQCFLQAKIYDLVKIKKDSYDTAAHKRLPYIPSPKTNVQANASVLVDGQPFAFINKLTQPKEAGIFFGLPTEILSQLQPMVRLYKIITTKNKKGAKIEKEVEIHFPTSTTADDLATAFKKKAVRGMGVGMKSFNYTYDGSDPFSVKKSIKASLKIHAASFDELLRTRKSLKGSGEEFSYIELALKTGSDKMGQNIQSDPNQANVIIDEVSKLQFRLKAIVGYQLPANLTMGRSVKDKELINQAINNSFVTLNLTPTIHDFDIDDYGRVNFTINYLAYTDDFFDNAYYNIFSNRASIISRARAGFKSTYAEKLYIKTLERECELEKKDKKEQNIKNDAERIKRQQILSLQGLLKPLFEKDLIRYITLPYKELKNFNRQGKNFNLTKAMSNNSNAPTGKADAKKDAMEAVKKNIEEPTETADPLALDLVSGQQQISFFYFSDLVDSVLENIETSLKKTYMEELTVQHKNGNVSATIAHAETKRLAQLYENFQRLRIVLGPIELSPSSTTDPGLYASIGDVPVSLKYFIEWMTGKLLAKDKFEYSLTSFINDFIKNYLRNFLNSTECFGGDSKQKIQFFNSTVTSYASNASSQEGTTARLDEITTLINNADINPSGRQRINIDNENIKDKYPILNTMGSRDNAVPTKGQAFELNHMVFYAGRSQPANIMTGDMGKDMLSGINHYILGRDIGIVKTIKLTKTQVTGLKELRYEQEGFDGLQQLREVYDANISTFLAPNTYPGTYIYVDPRGFAPSTKGYSVTKKDLSGKVTNFDKFELSKYGIGGYYMVIKSEHSIGEGIRDTNIIAKWVAALDDEKQEDKPEAKIETKTDQTKIEKCKARRNKEVNHASWSPPKDTVGTR